MTLAELNAFLAVCRYRNITKAAKELFVTQASLSARLKALEEDVGCKLLIRSKGNRKVSLTAKGQAVYRLALQHQDILSKIKAVGMSNSVDVLRIVSLTSVSDYVLAPVYERFIECFPNIRLSIVNNNAVTAVPNLIAGTQDMAFVTAKIETDQIIATPILSDPMTMVCSMDSDFPEVVSQAMLDVKDEVISHWSAEVAYWHTTVFGTDTIPFIRLEVMQQIGKYIAKPEKWGFVPQSMANELCKTYPIRQCKTTFPLPDRIVYLLRYRHTAESENIRLFMNTLQEVFEENKIQGSLI